MVRKVGPVHYWTESPGTGHNHSASPAAERQVSGSLLCHGALNFQQFVRWNLFESRNFSCGQGEFSQDHLGGFRRHVARRHVNARAALNRRLIEVVLCERQGIYAGGFCATPGFAKNHYVVRIPAKRVDVFVYALEGCRNVQDSLIPIRDILFSCQIRQEQVSEKSQTMIVRHYNNVVLTREVASILIPRTPGTNYEATAVVVEQYGTPTLVHSWRPDVEHQTVL